MAQRSMIPALEMSYEVNEASNFSILFDLVILLQTLRTMLWLSGVR